MPKFFVNSDAIKDNNIVITGTDVNHIKNVLRMKIKDVITVCDKENSKNFLCEIEKIEEEKVSTKILEKLESNAESDLEITIMQALPKADKMELIIQKATELGMKKMIPISMSRSIVKLQEKDKKKKQARWQTIAEVAAKQSGRDYIPKIEEVMNLNQICDQISQYDMVMAAYEKEETTSIKDKIKELKDQGGPLKVAVVIGPEGGIDPKEIEMLEKAGAKTVTLGKRILRTETVALVFTSIMMYELGDLN